MKTILAWHWSDGLRCRFDDRPIVPGETLIYKGEEPIELCERGLHASTKILHALGYAPGTTISRVRLSGEIIRGENKLVATERTCLWSFDATYILISWAADCAERALLREKEAGWEPDQACFAAIEAARQFAKDPSEENRKAADASGAYTIAGFTAYAARYTALAAASTSLSSTPLSYVKMGANEATWAAMDIAQAHGREGRAAVELEQKWQSARLRNLIAAGRAKI